MLKKIDTLGYSFQLSLLSSSEIVQNSNGEVTSSDHFCEGGLFCPKIFGPPENYTCDCGPLGVSFERHINFLDYLKDYHKQPPEEKLLDAIFGRIGEKLGDLPDRIIAHETDTCKICGKTITPIKQRIQNWGHIKLCAPVIHPWLLRGRPSLMSSVLNIPIKTILGLVFYDLYIVTYSEDQKKLPLGKVLNESQYNDYKIEFGDRFKAGTGAETIQKLLNPLNLKTMINEIEAEIKTTSVSKAKKLSSRLKSFNILLQSNSKIEDMVLTAIPVLPPDLREVTYSENKDKYIIKSINDSYRRVINKNNRLKRLIELKAPEIILLQEKRMLQEAVVTLFDSTTFIDTKMQSICDLLNEEIIIDVNSPKILFSANKNEGGPRKIIKDALLKACCAREPHSGKKQRDDLFDLMMCKIRGMGFSVLELND